MKILQVINWMDTAGAEKLLLETIPIYNKKGVQMDLLLLNGKKSPFFKELESQNICNIYCLGNSSIYNPKLIFKIIPFLKKYNIIHVHLFPSLYWVAISKIITFSNVKLIYTEHATTNKRMENTFFRMFDKYIYSKYEKIVCISNEVEKAIKKHLNFSIGKFESIPNGVNISKIISETSYLKSELKLQIKEDDILLIQVSRFQPPKDQNTLIKSLLYLPINVHLLLVGDGILKLESEKLVEELFLSKRVHFLGIRLDVPKLLKTADIVVLSSHYEGLSLASIEGLASGKPFVASDVPGLSEIVFGAGVLFQCQNERALAVKINRLIDEKDYRDNVINQCMNRAKEYDIEIMVKKHLNLYRSF
jgi:glycosyltransferase involved in cell wall biosynthesis